jgi:hypothetical protein
LVNLLVRTLLAHAPARVVVVASGVHDPAQTTGMPKPNVADLDTLAATGGPRPDAFSGPLAYVNSKLCNLWFAYELERRLAAAGLAAARPLSSAPLNRLVPGRARDYQPPSVGRFARRGTGRPLPPPSIRRRGGAAWRSVPTRLGAPSARPLAGAPPQSSEASPTRAAAALWTRAFTGAAHLRGIRPRRSRRRNATHVRARPALPRLRECRYAVRVGKYVSTKRSTRGGRKLAAASRS